MKKSRCSLEDFHYFGGWSAGLEQRFHLVHIWGYVGEEELVAFAEGVKAGFTFVCRVEAVNALVL